MKNRLLVSMMVAAGSMAGAASAGTFATFADPSTSAATPLFVLAGNTLSGGWSGLGLTLQTPGSIAPDYTDVTWVMTPLNRVGPAPFSLFSGGNIQFFDSSANMIFRIDFASSYLAEPISFGATDFIGQNVVFSGPIVDAPTSAESFAFSFANQVLTQDGMTATAAFTSSAVPAPGAAAVLGLAGLAGRRRRK
jgi:MYXO-CTERM domain-containing protein